MEAASRRNIFSGMNPLRVLAIAPHTDDLELGCGGTLARLVEAGSDITYVVLSIARGSVPEGLPEDILNSEVQTAASRLGIPSKRVLIHDFPVRRFPALRQEILEVFVSLRREVSPDLVLVPSTSDVHQDHSVVCEEAIRAFRRVTLWGYELYWNEVGIHPFSAMLFVELSEENVARKIYSLDAYKSQRVAGRAYMDPEIVRSHLQVRGLQAGLRLSTIK